MSKAMLYFLCLKSAFKIRNALNNNPNKIITFPTETLKILAGGLNRKFKFPQRRTEYYMKDWINFDINTLVRY